MKIDEKVMKNDDKLCVTTCGASPPMVHHHHQCITTCSVSPPRAAQFAALSRDPADPLKSIDKCVFINFCDKYAVFINFRDKNAVFTSFRDKNDIFELQDKNTVFGFNFVCPG